jgi:hypothetical protein
MSTLPSEAGITIENQFRIIVPGPYGETLGTAALPEWVDELRWGSMILAVLGLRAAAVRRRGATLAALVLGG